MSSNSVLENLRNQWTKYNNPPTAGTRSSNQPSKPKQIRQPTLSGQKPTILKSTFNAKCYTCHAPVVFNTLWWDDFNNCYIPLNEDMVPHKCKKFWHKTYERNSKLQSKIFHTF